MKIAVVTGASSGLGREYVRQLDLLNQKKKNQLFDEIWVIARRKERLLAMQREVKTSLRVLALDLTETESVQEYKQQLEQEKPVIRLLICSAGFGRVGSYADISLEDCDNMIHLNCRAAVDVTQVSIPYMRKGSRIAEICSMVGFLPLSYMNIYAASKAFLLRYSRALRVELKEKGILVTAVCPYWVKDTEFIEKSKKSRYAGYVNFYKGAGTTEKSVKKSLHAIYRGRAVSTPSPVSKIMRIVAAFLPDTVLLWGWEKIRHQKR